MSYARSPIEVFSMTIGTSIWAFGVFMEKSVPHEIVSLKFLSGVGFGGESEMGRDSAFLSHGVYRKERAYANGATSKSGK